MRAASPVATERPISHTGILALNTGISFYFVLPLFLIFFSSHGAFISFILTQ